MNDAQPSASMKSINPCQSVMQTLPPGYKQTEVGVIPEDWGTGRLGECLVAPPDYGINAPAVPHSDSLPRYIRITDITDDGRYSKESIVSVESPFSSRYLLNRGDLVFARTGASVGKTYLYDPDDGELVFAGYLIRVRPFPDKLDSRFLASWVTTARYWNWVKLMSTRTGQPGINGTEFAQLPLPLPTLPEQQAIAEALSDVDALISALDRLIAKKRAIKQRAMQELLTGRRRLPGFNGEWEVKRIGEFADCTAGGTPSTLISAFWGGTIRWMSSDELHQRFVTEVAGRITEAGLQNSSTKLIPSHCVLIGLAGQGKTRGTVAVNLVELCTNQSIAAVIPSPEFVPEYLYYNLDTRYEELRGLSTGDGGRGGLNLTIIKSIPVPLPNVEEQAAITAVLLDMDAEIAALERRRDKTKLLKQGMMQELLTGKTRLL